MIQFLVPRGQDTNILDYLALSGQGLEGRLAVLCYEDLIKRHELPPGPYVLSALDQLSPAMRALLHEACQQLVAANPGIVLLNSPTDTLLRFELLQTLHAQGLNRFRAVRARDREIDLRFPVFIREEHQHWASLTPLLATPADLDRGLTEVLRRGHRLQDLLVVEFCDTVDAAGFFRKYSVYVVGREVIPSGMSRGRHWSLKHSRSDFTREMLLEEQSYVLGNPHEELVRPIFETACVGYGRLDYAMKDGVVQAWEINLNPRIGRRRGLSQSHIPDELRPLREVAKAHFHRRFQAAFEALDPPGGVEHQTPVRYHPATLRAARATLRQARARGRWAPVKRFLQPISTLLGLRPRPLPPG